MTRTPVPPRLRAAARRLRRDMTEAERTLWRALRAHRLEGRGFRRQLPIGPFVVDFACPSARLVVEVDGGQHADSAADARRDAWLSGRGWRVLRFWNSDVLGNPEGVLALLAEALAADAPPPQPSPARGEGARRARGALRRAAPQDPAP